ncbi:MAG: nucleoside kinase [Tissierellia bacterium]|nr:nucleoside kinase [Tissierellia bacterium]
MKITVSNKIYEFDEDMTLLELARRLYPEDYTKYFGAIIDNTIFNLHHILYKDEVVDFIDLKTDDGYKILTRTMTLILALALKRLDPQALLQVEHFIGEGLYFEIEGISKIDKALVQKLKAKMQEVIAENLSLKRHVMPIDEANQLFEAEGYWEKVKLLNTLALKQVDVYLVAGHAFSFHGYLAPSTGFAKDFELELYHPGIIMTFPSPQSGGQVPAFVEEKSLAKIFSASKRWTQMQGIGYAASLNRAVLADGAESLIEITEAYFENSLSRVADGICSDKEANFILIAGPSSSGKTTTAKRLAVQLAVRGKRPLSISVDDYFIDRERTPKNEKGDPDFESIYAVDLDAFNEDLVALMEGEQVRLPKFDFKTGTRSISDQVIQMDEEHPVIIEGIHALNPILTCDVPEKNKFKIYISALTQLNLDAHNRISVTDVRLLRRIVRDHHHRNNTAEQTLRTWYNVRAGEEKWIFPYQGEADVHLDTSLIYELAVLKKHVMPLLQSVDQSCGCYKDAKRLMKFLEYFLEIRDDSPIPYHSILREFIGRRTLG